MINISIDIECNTPIHVAYERESDRRYTFQEAAMKAGVYTFADTEWNYADFVSLGDGAMLYFNGQNLVNCSSVWGGGFLCKLKPNVTMKYGAILSKNPQIKYLSDLMVSTLSHFSCLRSASFGQTRSNCFAYGIGFKQIASYYSKIVSGRSCYLRSKSCTKDYEDRMKELVSSVREIGLIQPISVVERGEWFMIVNEFSCL
jgi:hypothetical protein